MKKLNLSGHKFGRLTVMKENGRLHGHRIAWLCRCECGKEKTISTECLRSGFTKSCGCLRADVTSARSLIHGQSGDSRKRIPQGREYRAWRHAKARCHNPNDEKFAQYGKRGIKMCERWRSDFCAFLSDMGPCPDGLSLDRIKVNGDYEPGNCQWADSNAQANNKQDSRNVRLLNGQKETLKQFSIRNNLKYKTVHARLKRAGVTELDEQTVLKFA